MLQETETEIALGLLDGEPHDLLEDLEGAVAAGKGIGEALGRELAGNKGTLVGRQRALGQTRTVVTGKARGQHGCTVAPGVEGGAAGPCVGESPVSSSPTSSGPKNTSTVPAP